MPRVLHEVTETAAQQSVHEATLQQQLVQALAVIPALLHLTPYLEDAHEDDEVQDPDDPQKGRRHTRADHAADRVPRVEVALDGLGRDRKGQRQQEHDGRMSEREEEPHAQRTLASLHQEPRGVVDGRDVVCVECVPKAEGVGEGARSRVCGPEVVVVQEEEPPPEDVEKQDESVHAPQAGPFAWAERHANSRQRARAGVGAGGDDRHGRHSTS